jgi:hypothetical protein
MNFSPVIAVGWRSPTPGKPAALVVLYEGDMIEPAIAAINDALDRGVISAGRAFRGQFGSGQLQYAADLNNRPAPVGEILYPATGSNR